MPHLRSVRDRRPVAQTTVRMNPNVGGIRLKLSTAAKSRPVTPLPQAEQEAGHSGARALAKTIAAYTVKLLVDGEMLDPVSAADELIQYGVSLEKGLHVGEGILRFLFPDEGRLAMVLFTSGRSLIGSHRRNPFTKPIPRYLRPANSAER